MGGGWCVFYLRSNITYKPREDLQFEPVESFVIEIIKPRSKPFLLCTWYRPPDSPSSFFQPFEQLLDKIDCLNYEFHLLGDLNCNFLRDDLESHTTKLSNICDIYGITQLIKDPTRITETSRTLIDVLLTNSPDKFKVSACLSSTEDTTRNVRLNE